MVNSCFKLLRKGARIVMIGLPKATVQIEDPLPNLIFKSVTLTTETQEQEAGRSKKKNRRRGSKDKERRVQRRRNCVVVGCYQV